MRQALLLPLFFLAYCGNDVPQTQPANNVAASTRRTYIIFLDLTGSLNSAQQASVTQRIAELCDGMPARANITVLPLGGFVDRAGVLLRQQLADDTFSDGEQALSEQKAALPDLIASAVQNYTKSITDPHFLRHTCISQAIHEAQQRINNSETTENTEVVFISDMLEDCTTSLLGGPLLLERTDIRAELSRAELVDHALADLHGANVTAIIPETGPTSPRIAQPTVTDLETFWSRVFSHCNTRSFALATSIPGRLLRHEQQASTE